MLSFIKKEKYLAAPSNGAVIGITDVSDQVFSQKILGDGFAVVPKDGSFYSPTDGTVTDISSTLHAYCIKSDDGLEILLHIGIDTVELKGKHFTPLTAVGDRVKTGTPLALADLDAIRAAGYSTVTVTVITNSDSLSFLRVLKNPSAAAGDRALVYKI